MCGKFLGSDFTFAWDLYFLQSCEATHFNWHKCCFVSINPTFFSSLITQEMKSISFTTCSWRSINTENDFFLVAGQQPWYKFHSSLVNLSIKCWQVFQQPYNIADIIDHLPFVLNSFFFSKFFSAVLIEDHLILLSLLTVK